MNPRLSARILIAASIGYGITVALLGYLDSAAVGIFAFAGALVLGGLWAVRGIFLNR